MRRIEIVSNLKMSSICGPISKDSTGKWVRVHYQQGELDGACAAYSTVMNLLILGKVSEDDFFDGKTDKRTRVGKLLADLLDNQGMIRNGLGFRELADNIRKRLKDDIRANRRAPRNHDDTINYIKNSIEKDMPIVISVVFKDGIQHAILAVGMEYDESENPCRLLCLDPGEPTSRYAEWNSYIDISNNSEKHCYVSGKRYQVTLNDMLLITERE